ncbi:ABC transporter permease [Sinisalibacter aestuarii]|uniref:ABC transporter permease n=1 Tax=Sinisalibacter aestuarii TaxID=2949426 RepID=A0ABQ5LY60_9RHOB|nr:ABC transporter permease [Sinisalibacter aestuarii]GKY89903.1 ABC transporter permease [Sinisalibacter aestuarii]
MTPTSYAENVQFKLARQVDVDKAKRRKRTINVVIMRILVLAALLVPWQLGVEAGLIDPLFFSSPSAILTFLVTELGSGGVWPHVLVTVREALMGFLIGAVAGVAAGILRMQFPLLADVTNPFLTILNVLPRVALAPMFVLWFGIGEGSKIALSVSLVFFILMLNTEAGIKSLDRELIITQRALGATRTQLFWKVMLPGAVPAMFSGMRLGVVYSLLAVVVGEMIASQMGLGQRIAFYAASFQGDGLLGTILILAAIGLIFNVVVVNVEAKLMHWRLHDED